MPSGVCDEFEDEPWHSAGGANEGKAVAFCLSTQTALEVTLPNKTARFSLTHHL